MFLRTTASIASTTCRPACCRNCIKQIIHHLKAKGIGVLITDHNVRETLDICETAYIVNDGQLIAEGDSATILANELVKEVYLGHEFRL